MAEQLRGVTFSKSDAISEPCDGYVPILTASNLQDGRLVTEALTYVPSSKVRARQRVQVNDVVICASSGSLSVVGKAAHSRGDFDGAFGAFLKVLRPGPEVDPGYFAHFFQTPAYRREVSALAAGANINNLKNEHLDALTMPLPPLPEQRRIAAILDHADALRVKRRQILTQLDSLTQSIFQEMFGDPDTATATEPFGSVADLQGGRNLVADDASAETRYRVLKISAVTTGRFKASESKPLPADYKPPREHLLRDGDLLMSRANTTEMVGAVAYVEAAPPNVCLPDKVWRFVWKTKSEPRFYQALLSTPAMRRRISRLSSGTGGAMKNVSKTKLEAMPLPVVPHSAQQRFVQRVEVLERQRSAVQRALATDDELFASLQARAFQGTL